jgi:hypothetical protein
MPDFYFGDSYPLVLTDTGVVAELPAGTAIAGITVDSVSGLSTSLSGKESVLGNPASDGQVLSSTAAGVRSWVDRGGSPGLVLLATATASNVTSVDFTSGIDSTYDEYEIHYFNVLPAEDGIDLYIRTSSNSGSSFDSGASDYSWLIYESTLSGATTSSGGNYGDSEDTYIRLTRNGVSNNSAKYGYSGIVSLIKPSSTTVYKTVIFSGAYQGYVHALNYSRGSAQRLSTSAINAIRFLFSSGNIASGEFKLYGLRKSL